MMGNVIQMKRKEAEPEREVCLAEKIDANNVINDFELAWHCVCGHPLFFVTEKRGIICQECGEVQSWNNDK